MPSAFNAYKSIAHEPLSAMCRARHWERIAAEARHPSTAKAALSVADKWRAKA